MNTVQFQDFINRLGFDENPFAKTNASNEERLERYFVRPKYFATLQGDPAQPESVFVFAPRGSGKTAQKVMLEKLGPAAAILPISYDYFPIPSDATQSSFSVDYHLNNVLRQGALSLAAYMIEYNVSCSELTPEARGQLRLLLTAYVGTSTSDAIDSFSQSLLGRGEKLVAFWNKWSKVGTAIISPLLRYLGLDGVAVPDLPTDGTQAEREALQHYELLKRVAKALKFRSIHVLIDRVDETQWTGNDPERSYLLIRSLVRTLPLLDDPFVGWKFFLWDSIDKHCRADARPDRVKQFYLKWTHRELADLLGRRCDAFSNGGVRSLSRIMAEDIANFAEEACVVFSNRSPRNLIRLTHSVLAEQVEIDGESGQVTEPALEAGINNFCDISLPEQYPEEHIRHMRRIGRLSFTIAELANKVFKETTTSTNNRVRAWEASGLVVQNGTIKLRKAAGKPSNYYMLGDPRAARVVLQGTSIKNLMSDRTFTCTQCGEYIFSELEDREDDFICPHCERPAL